MLPCSLCGLVVLAQASHAIFPQVRVPHQLKGRRQDSRPEVGSHLWRGVIDKRQMARVERTLNGVYFACPDLQHRRALALAGRAAVLGLSWLSL